MECRRPNCRLAASKSRHQGYCYKHYEVVPHGFVDADECRGHMEALRITGYSWRAIGRLTGVHVDTLRNIRQKKYDKVEVNTHLKIMAVPLPDEIVGGYGLVSNVGTTRRLKALSAIGYSREDLADALGVTSQCVQWFFHRDRVAASTVVRVRELFDRLQMTPGPSPKARQIAAKKGWLPPLAWDEDTIDDPTAEPQLPQDARDAWYDTYLELKSLGYSDEMVAERMGYTRQWLVEKRRRHETSNHHHERE